VRDYNNSVKHLAKGGIIFMHDMVPPSEEFTAQHYCGDAYRLLYDWLMYPAYTPTFYTQDGDYGLTVVTSGFRHLAPAEGTVSYSKFMGAVTMLLKRYTTVELQQIISELPCDS
jgi:hypothetical protein